jgi:hypothetical protein
MAQLVHEMKNLKIFGLCLLVVTFAWGTLSASGQSQPDFSRTIAGVVVDKEEQPIAGAKVCAWGTGPMGSAVPCAQSNPDGRFTIDVYRPDTYTIKAEDLAQGYPEARWGFYGKLFCNFPVVTIDDTRSVTPVKVKLGLKAGRVIFTILDEETNKPIEKGSINVCRIGDPKSCWLKSTSFPHGQYELLTPEVPFTVKFETWETAGWVQRAAFDESDVPIEVLQVDLGARKEIKVRLK